MRSLGATAGLLAATAALFVFGGCSDDASAQRELGFERTEEREDCRDYDELRQPFFGSTHLHTGLSFDASLRLVRPGPRDAYAFARGLAPVLGVDEFGLPTRRYFIDRPIDFGAVTDHAEHFAEMGVCNSQHLPGPTPSSASC